jgi:hypothetical protein
MGQIFESILGVDIVRDKYAGQGQRKRIKIAVLLLRMGWQGSPSQ